MPRVYDKTIIKSRYVKVPAIVVELCEVIGDDEKVFPLVSVIDHTYTHSQDRRPGFIYIDPSFELSSDDLSLAIDTINRRISHLAPSTLSDNILSYFISDTFIRLSPPIPVVVSFPKKEQDVLVSLAESRPPRFRKVISRRNKSAKKQPSPEIAEPKYNTEDSKIDPPEIEIGSPVSSSPIYDKYLQDISDINNADTLKIIQESEMRISRAVFDNMKDVFNFEYNEKLKRYYTETSSSIVWVTITD